MHTVPARPITIHAVDSLNAMDACVHLQQSVWQFPDLDIVPRRMFVVARTVGGQVFGAWDEGTLIGYALAIPGVRNGRPYLHSQMLAVSPAYRNRGVGLGLKLAQRVDALERGIELIEWTFDPMQIKNAYFNIEKLGAVVRRYTPDFYGPSKSPVHGYLPTDRLHAEWWLKSDRVNLALAGKGQPNYPILETITVTKAPTQPDATLLPTDVSALETLLSIRGKFLAAFSNGLAVLRFQFSDKSASYLLGAHQQVVDE